MCTVKSKKLTFLKNSKQSKPKTNVKSLYLKKGGSKDSLTSVLNRKIGRFPYLSPHVSKKSGYTTVVSPQITVVIPTMSLKLPKLYPHFLTPLPSLVSLSCPLFSFPYLHSPPFTNGTLGVSNRKRPCLRVT